MPRTRKNTEPEETSLSASPAKRKACVDQQEAASSSKFPRIDGTALLAKTNACYSSPEFKERQAVCVENIIGRLKDACDNAAEDGFSTARVDIQTVPGGLIRRLDDYLRTCEHLVYKIDEVYSYDDEDNADDITEHTIGISVKVSWNPVDRDWWIR